MKIGSLDFLSVADHRELLAPATARYLLSLPAATLEQIGVAEIDPNSTNGIECCERYGFDPAASGTCIIVQASRADRKWFAACLTPTDRRIDLNGVVRRHLGARRVSFATHDEAVALSGMQYGGINVIGLPDDWPILIDASLAAQACVIIGSGLVHTKLALPGSLLATLPNVELIDDLSRSTS